MTKVDEKGLFLVAWRGASPLSDVFGQPETEFRFASHLRRLAATSSGRPLQFAFDFGWPDYRIAVEVDGGGYMVRRTKGGQMIAIGSHASAADYEKVNLAQELGWRVFRFRVRELRDNPWPAVYQVLRALYAVSGRLLDADRIQQAYGPIAGQMEGDL